MKIAEIETPGSGDGWREWLVIYYRAPDYISFAHEYTCPRSPVERSTWQDQGSGFTFGDIDMVIDALQRIKEMGPMPSESPDKEG